MKLSFLCALASIAFFSVVPRQISAAEPPGAPPGGGLSQLKPDSTPPATRVVVVFGDSITAGSALPAAERAQVWVQLVETQSGGRLLMVNEGKGGRPTDSVKEFEAMLARIAR